MKITGLILYDYVRLRVSRIRELEINTESDNVQLIIGSNGSGKSSVMHELFPFPPIKSSFGKEGFKELSLQHNNALYKLTYSPTYGHQFFKNGGKNLNISNTNEIQKELIYEHFGITPEIHTVLKCSLPICEMVPSQRKKVLMSMNPVDVDVFITKYQKVHKDVVAYSNNLDMLYERQKRLMTQKLPDEQYKDMLERKAMLENQEKLLLIWMTTVSSELDMYPEISANTDMNGTTTKRIYELFKSLPKFSGVSRSKYQSQMVVCNTKAEMITAELKDIESSIEDVISILNDYETKKELLNADGSNVEEELSSTLLQLKTFSFADDFNPIPTNQISRVIELNDAIRDILVELTYIEYPRISDKEELNSFYKQVIELKSGLNNLLTNISNLKKQREDLRKTITTYKTNENCKDCGNCNREACELFSVYSTHTDSKKKEISAFDERLSSIEVKYVEMSETYEKATAGYNIQLNLWKHIDRILHIIHSNRALTDNFNDKYVLSQIRESPMLLVDEISKYIQLSSEYAEYKKLLKRVEELEGINATLTSKKLLSIDVLNTEILAHTKQLTTLRKKYEIKSGIISKLQTDHDLLKEFSDVKQKAHDFKDEMIDLESNVKKKASREYIVNLYNVLNRMLVNIRSELVDITNISKEQEKIIVRLDTEVNNIINDLKPKHENAKLIEKSLHDLPIEYTTIFINNIIETANYFINEIMTYSMHLVPIPDGDVCDFSFPVIIENEVRTKDISSCSDGQRAIIQLAFNLAIVVELRFNEYPIFSDETNRTLDITHSKRLTEFLLKLETSGIVSQLFVVNHDPTMIDRLAHTGNIVVLNGDNLVLPERYNQNVKIVYY